MKIFMNKMFNIDDGLIVNSGVCVELIYRSISRRVAMRIDIDEHYCVGKKKMKDLLCKYNHLFKSKCWMYKCDGWWAINDDNMKCEFSYPSMW